MPQFTSDPAWAVASTPVRETTKPDAPQFSTPQPSCPHPVFISVVIVSDPVDEVVDTPVNVTSIESYCHIRLHPMT